MEHGKSTLVSLLTHCFQNVVSIHTTNHGHDSFHLFPANTGCRRNNSLVSRHFESSLTVLTTTYVCFPPFCTATVSAVTCFAYFASHGRRNLSLFCRHSRGCARVPSQASAENSTWNKELCAR